ncbi:MAG: glycoside hydrolase [Betaproteobacteria bacterium]|nr:MAG: glycoside hydrolase [Betaproteobacteria bacterium]
MTSPRLLDLVLVWHMHQPDYRDHASGEFMLPWVYLHAIKDYTDMAWHLERHPGMRAVINWVPVLLDQLEDYADQFASGTLRDPLLRLLARDHATALTEDERTLVLERCLRADNSRMIEPYPPFKHLHDLFRTLEARGGPALRYLSDHYFYDVLVWYHLAWTGETVRRESELVPRLMAIGQQFEQHHRHELFRLIGELVRGVVGRYARLAEAGRIELSTTPHYHPLAPLLLDFHSAREAEPQAPLPETAIYPGGRERVMVHLRTALESHTRRFGATPRGVWPAEGSVSSSLVGLLSGSGLAWTASGEQVLANSIGAAHRGTPRSHYLYRPYRLRGAPDLALFFRDDKLSDRIGFEYRKWHGSDAAANFVGELESIAAEAGADERPLVSVILDGENAWEHYPYNAYYFLSELYKALESHPSIRPTTFDAFLLACSNAGAAAGRPPAATHQLERLVAGSWVYGNFATWIGSTDKNRAWDLLCAVKQSFDLVRASGRLDADGLAAAERQLADCEGSDWFWWFGDYNSSASVASFDQLYRAKLANLYRLIELPVPAVLSEPISHGHGDPEGGGSMRRGDAPKAAPG